MLTRVNSHSRVAKAALAAVAVLATLTMAPSPARAAAPGVAWSLHSAQEPTSFQPSDEDDRYTLLLTNVGGKASTGPITLTDTLPAGIVTAGPPEAGRSTAWTCKNEKGEEVASGETEFTCESGVEVANQTESVAALTTAEWIHVPVQASPGASGANVVQASGGGATRTASMSDPLLSDVSSVPFAPLAFSASALDVSGAEETQAAGHPAALTSTFDLTTASLDTGVKFGVEPAEAVRQVVIDLPAGLVGDPQAAPKCSLSDLASLGHCEPDTRVGTLVLNQDNFVATSLPIFNIVPEEGYAAEFGVFEPAQMRAVVLYASVRTGSDYGLRITSAPTDEFIHVTGVSALFFGDPAVQDNSGQAPLAFFSNPTDCSQPNFKTTIHVDSWQHPGRFNADGTPDFTDPNWKTSPQPAISPRVTGCEGLRFNPEIEIKPAEPETAAADSPTGLSVDLRVPQNQDPYGLATPELKDAVVRLPAGMAVSPSVANGREACTPAQIALNDASKPSCPDGAKIGAVEIVTPALTEPLRGSAYLAQQTANPFGSLLAIYLVAEGSGVLLKLAGHVEADPVTGQLTTRFEGNPPFEGEPQQQFSDLKLDFFGGPRAALITPPACGSYPVISQLTPWSGGAPAEPPSGFTVASGCAVGGFAPSFSAGTANNQAGGYSAFSTTFSRHDGEQRLGSVQLQLPPGLLGKIAGVPQCLEPQANAGTCSSASQIGTATAGAGPGPDPVYVPQAGQPPNPVYLTGPYKGAPFGLSIVTHAAAGPFDLGTVVVRAAIDIDPHTAQITVTSDPLPAILQGIPLDIRTINVNVDRPGFIFNPSDCEALAVHGTIISTGGASAAVSSPFQAANCAALPFKPRFTASTQGSTSKANGASLVVKVAQKPGEANIHKVNLQLPLALPSRLTTLQKACLAAVFEANPAACPAASVIGTAKAVTPVLNVPLTGPAYLVSHGGAAFPDVEFILQGEGVEILLDGKTDIKKGITYSRFGTVPDAPISSFETVLPEGPHSIFGTNIPASANHSLCGQTLTMPTTIVGQNGAQVTQSTNIAVTGCGKPSIKITKAKIKGNTVLVTVTTSQPGTVTVSGNGLKTIRKTLGAGAHQLKVSLTKNGRTARKHHKKTKVKASVKNSNGSSSKTMTLKL
jgi:hypothetical protein